MEIDVAKIVKDIKFGIKVQLDSFGRDIISQVNSHFNVFQEKFETSINELKTKIEVLSDKISSLENTQTKPISVPSSPMNSTDTIQCSHMVSAGTTIVLKANKRQCKNNALEGLSYCHFHFTMHNKDLDNIRNLKKLAQKHTGFVRRIHYHYNEIANKPIKTSADKNWIGVFNIIKEYIIEHKEENIKPVPMDEADYKNAELDKSNRELIPVVGSDKCLTLQEDFSELYKKMETESPAQEAYVKHSKFNMCDYLNHIYIYDFEPPQSLSSYNDPNKSYKLISSGVRLGNMFSTCDSVVNVVFQENSILNKPVSHIDIVAGELLYVPLVKNHLTMLKEQTKFNIRNMGIILDTTNELYTNHRETRTLHNPLGSFERTYLNFAYPDSIDNPSLKMGSWDEQAKLEIVSYENGQYINSKLALNHKKKHILKHYHCGYIADPYTGYIYHPTKYGTVAIGVGNTESLTYKITATHTVSTQLPANASEHPFLSTVVAMFNKFEVMHLISDRRNFLNPETGDVVWYNKLVNGVVKYNANYFKQNQDKFESQDFPPSPIDVNVTIPPELHTSMDAKQVDNDGCESDYGFKSYGFKHLTGTNTKKYRPEIRDDIDKYTCALSYVRVPGLFCSLGQFREYDDLYNSHMIQITKIGEPGSEGNINSHLSNARNRVKLDFDLFYDPQFMGSVNGLELECIQKDFIEKIMPDTNHHYIIGNTRTGCFIDPLTKMVFSVRGNVPVCIGVICCSQTSVNEHNRVMTNYELIKHFKFYYLDEKDIEVCRAHNYNYLDYESRKIVYYNYCDVRTWRILYNLNYHKNPRGILLPSYVPPRGALAPRTPLTEEN